MAAKNLTARSIDALTYTRTDGNPVFLWDGQLRGFGVRITAGGAKSFVCRYRVNGRQRLATLGSVAVHRLQAAREWARDGLALAHKGIDFQLEQKRGRDLGTMADVWQRYLDESIRGRSSAATVANFKSLWERHLSRRFGSQSLLDLTTPDIRARHRTLSTPQKPKKGRPTGGPYLANRALQALRAAINYQIDRGDGTLPPGFRNPCIGVELNREQPRSVILKPTELPKLAKAIDAHPDPYMRAFLWLSLYTGARRGELLRLSWDDVDLKAKEVRFGVTKNGTPHTVPLAAAAVKLLKGLPRLEGSPYVIPGRHGKGHRVNVKDAWGDIRTAAELPHLRLHDLRRTVGSWLGAKGRTAQQVGELLNHKSDITSRVYVQLADMNVKRELAGEHGRLVAKALKPKKARRKKKSSNVVPFPRKGAA